MFVCFICQMTACAFRFLRQPKKSAPWRTALQNNLTNSYGRRVANGFSRYPPEFHPALFGLFPRAAHLVWTTAQQALQ
jgi:hypothetical protein